MKKQKVNDPYGVARIKTQHSALGLLMAECEQLRRDMAQAKADNLELYKKWVGLRQSLTEAKVEDARLAAALEEIDRCSTGSMSIVHIQEVARKALRC